MYVVCCRKVKHSQIVSGVKWYNFWLSTFIWDFINFLIPALALLALFAAADISNFTGNNFSHVEVIVLYLLKVNYIIAFSQIECDNMYLANGRYTTIVLQ